MGMMTSATDHRNYIDGMILLFNEAIFINIFVYITFSDTPHHLKNKRVQHNINSKKDHEILTNALQQESKQKLQQIQTVQSPIAENPSAEQSEQETENSNSYTKQPQQPFEAPLSPIQSPAVMVTSTLLPTESVSHPLAAVTDGE